MKYLLILIFNFHLVICASQEVTISIDSIDGIINDVNGLRTKDSDRSKYSITMNDSLIYLSIDSEQIEVASVCICDKTKITVYHASAALGQLEYEKQANGQYVTNQRFSWGLKNVLVSEDIRKAQLDYFKLNGWVANTMMMGNKGQTEFVFDRSRFESSDLRFAFGLMPASNPEEIIAMPFYKNKGCASLSLVSGDPKSTYDFNPGIWLPVIATTASK